VADIAARKPARSARLAGERHGEGHPAGFAQPLEGDPSLMPELHRGDYVLSSDPAAVDGDRVHEWLSGSYWAKGRERNVVDRSIAGSRPYSVHLGAAQVAFARVVTDGATFAWICDVYVDDAHRGRGLATWLVDTIVADLTAAGVLRLLLATKDAHDVYRRSGFEVLEGAGRFMEIDRRPTRNAILGLDV
jgi:GNAT superfamily N-acetyltransferase